MRVGVATRTRRHESTPLRHPAGRSGRASSATPPRDHLNAMPPRRRSGAEIGLNPLLSATTALNNAPMDRHAAMVKTSFRKDMRGSVPAASVSPTEHAPPLTIQTNKANRSTTIYQIRERVRQGRTCLPQTISGSTKATGKVISTCASSLSGLSAGTRTMIPAGSPDLSTVSTPSVRGRSPGCCPGRACESLGDS